MRLLWIVGLMALALSGAASARASLLPCGVLSPCPPPPTKHKRPSPPPVAADHNREFDGHRGKRLYADVRQSRTASRLVSVSFAFTHGRCSDGSAFSSGGGSRIRQGARIGSHGSVRYARSYARAFNFDRRGRRVNGAERFALRLRFAGDRANGTLRDVFSSRRLHCDSGAMALTIYRDGTPEAPLHNSNLTTGRYAGTATDVPRGRQAPHALSLDAFLPWSTVDLSFGWRERCGGGGASNVRSAFSLVALGSRAGYPYFEERGHGAFSYRHGVHEYYTYDLRGEFSGGTRYRMIGAWSYNSDVYRRGLYLGSCSGYAALNGKFRHA